MIRSRILIVGCGKMGTALVNGWLNDGLEIENLKIIEIGDHDKIKKNLNNAAVSIHSNISELSECFSPDIIVFAIKPQVAQNLLPLYARYTKTQKLFLSIMGGLTTSLLKKFLGEKAKVVRAMPNTPSAIGKGVSVIFAGADISNSDKEVCKELLETVGSCEWIASEESIDAVTALSGSGPAYVFYLSEAMAEAGVELGLSHELSDRLARLTIDGSGSLLTQKNIPAVDLRENVTSKGGTTEAALKVLGENNVFKKLIRNAIRKAQERSIQLGR